MIGTLFVISAPSGAGKTTLVTHLLERLKDDWSIDRVITYTTKEPRPTEVQAKDYYFISMAEFERRILEGYFLEWSNAYGNYYGSPASIREKLAQGHHKVIITDRTGAKSIKNAIPEAVLVWLYAESVDVLKKRIEKRGQDSDRQLCLRLNLAQQEIEQEKLENLFDFHVLNQNFFEALEHLTTIFLKKLAKN